ncbi:MAG: sulfite exporter TauE/SafE family protein [Desulfobacterales bacterium]|nr:MAG: sulfite exporter TauE/SafE family protein [Desulfobacterales bacterium]
MSSIETLYVIFFITGFTVGFGHCIGMCGPIVVSMSLNLGEKRILIPNLFYHAGRITTYGVLGGILGVTGAFTRVTAGIANLQKGVLIFAGLVIVIMGLGMGGWVSMGKVFGDDYRSTGIITRGFSRLSKVQSTSAYLPLGLLLGLLPCGPVYTTLIASARVGMEFQNTFKAALAGAGLMVVFGIGTIPALLLVARLASMEWLRYREGIYKIGSMLMIALGIYFIIKGIQY